MNHNAEAMLPTRTVNKSSCCSFVQEENKFHLFSVTSGVGTDEFDNVVTKRLIPVIPLDDFEHLLLQICLISNFINSPELQINYFEEMQADIQHASQIAINAGIAIAHYYKAEALAYMEGKEATDQIKEHYKKALAAHEAPAAFREKFNQFVPKLRNLRPSEPTTFDGMLKRLEEKYNELFYPFTEDELLDKAITAPGKKEKGEFLHELARRYDVKGNVQAAIKYNLAATLLGSNEAKSYLRRQKAQYPDLDEFIDTMKATVEKDESLHSTTRLLKFVDCFLPIYAIYCYFYSNKDTPVSRVFNVQESQHLEQTIFMWDLKRLAKIQPPTRFEDKEQHYRQTFLKLEQHLASTEEEFGLTGLLYERLSSPKGKNEFHELRVNVLKAAKVYTPLLVSKAGVCFLNCLESQLHLEGCFSKTLWTAAKTTTATVKLDGKM